MTRLLRLGRSLMLTIRCSCVRAHVLVPGGLRRRVGGLARVYNLYIETIT